MKLLKRAVRIFLGFIAATFLALLAGLTLPWLSPGPGAEPQDFLSWNFFALAGIYWLLIALFTVIPALIAVILAETIKLRSLIAHIVIGGIIGLFLSGQPARISPWLNLADVPVQDVFASAIFVLAGALGALAYWAIAGRFAGEWKRA